VLQGKVGELTGLVEVFGTRVFITVNPTCKCRVSYRVVGKRWRKLLVKFRGRFISVLGWLSKTSPWSGYIYPENFREVKVDR